MKYSASITGWGVEALDFLDDGFVVIFDTNAPEELAEIAILHEHAELTADPAPGDKVTFCGKTYTITAVGDEALHTLRSMGHCTLVFSGAAEVELPGQIALKGEALQKADVQVGAKIEIA